MDSTIDQDDTQPITTTADGRHADAAQVDAWVRDAEEKRAAALKSPAEMWEIWLAYKADCEREERTPIHAGLSRRLGFCTEEGLRHAARRGGAWARQAKEIELELFNAVMRRLIDSKSGQVGVIFYAKNRLGFRDKSPEEQQQIDDWIKRITEHQAATGSNTGTGHTGGATREAQPVTRRAGGGKLQLLHGEDDTPDSGMESDLVAYDANAL